MMPRGSDSSADPTVASMPPAVLLGRDHVEARTTALRTAGRCAVGIARGWEPKPYRYVDPNEDAVAAVDGPEAQLLVVADGHHGHEASHEAVATVLSLLGTRLRAADLRGREVRDVVRAVSERVWAVSTGELPSRTTLVVALRTRRHVQWFAAGDSSLLVVHPTHPYALATFSRWFVGDDPAVATTRRGVRSGRIAVSADAAVVAATDGWSDYLPLGMSPEQAAATAVRDAPDAARAAAALLDQARAGGAGDNVGVAVSPAWDGPPAR